MGLSPVSVISHCEQATPPITPRVRGDSRIRSLGDLLSNASACVSAWHPREAETRPLPPCPCLAPSPPPVTGRRWLRTSLFGKRKFEQGFLDEYGPAQVGLGPPFTGKRLHRLRLSQRHLRFTPHTEYPRGRPKALRPPAKVLAAYGGLRENRENRSGTGGARSCPDRRCAPATLRFRGASPASFWTCPQSWSDSSECPRDD